jgi:hypothetical protein
MPEVLQMAGAKLWQGRWMCNRHAFAATVRDDEIEKIANFDCVYALAWLVAVLHVLVG